MITTALFTTLGLLACSPSGDSELSIQMVDAATYTARSSSEPLEGIEHAWLTIDQAEVRGVADAEDTGDDSESGWVLVSNVERTIDLVEVSEGRLRGLGTAGLEPGDYDELRLRVVSAEVEYEGAVEEMKVPSGSSSGLKIKGDFTLGDGMITVVTLDFDVNASISWNQGSGYKLDPVLRFLSVEQVEPGSLDTGETVP